MRQRACISLTGGDAMTRDDLIEAVARAQYESVWGYEDHTSWEDLHPDTRATVRDVIHHTAWPLVVEFVAKWMDDKEEYVAATDVGIDSAGDEQSQTVSWLGWKWREEMGDA